MLSLLPNKIQQLSQYLLGHKLNTSVQNNKSLIYKQFVNFNFLLSPMYIKEVDQESINAVLITNNRKPIKSRKWIGQLALASELAMDMFWQQHTENSSYTVQLIATKCTKLHHHQGNLRLNFYLKNSDLETIWLQLRSQQKRSETFEINVYDTKDRLCYICNLKYDLVLGPESILLE